MNHRYELELADILKSCQDTLNERHHLCAVQLKAIEDIINCRTANLNGHLKCCNACGYQQQAYNSCRNRHCPKCQYLKQEQWVDKVKGRLLPGRYFHMVFTIPQQLHPLFYLNQECCYTLLFQSAWEALKQAGKNPRYLGADVGTVCVLHTWGQTLTYHPHVHMVVPAGGLSEDGTEWMPAPKKFFVPVKALSSMFRGILVRKLKRLLDSQQLKCPDGFCGFETLKKELYLKKWNVYSKKAFGGVNSVLEYLGRYTHRVAISNNRLIKMENNHVSFRYKDYHNGNRQCVMQLDTNEFARRFLQHILPAGFYKIRYFGILATANIYTLREQAFALIGQTVWLPMLEGLTAYEVLRQITGKDPAICPVCNKGVMRKKPVPCQLE